jgi:multidrug resistance efflux pump
VGSIKDRIIRLEAARATQNLHREQEHLRENAHAARTRIEQAIAEARAKGALSEADHEGLHTRVRELRVALQERTRRAPQIEDLSE